MSLGRGVAVAGVWMSVAITSFTIGKWCLVGFIFALIVTMAYNENSDD